MVRNGLRRRVGAEYFAGYIVEKSLSVDNLFVFVVIMTTFAVPGACRGP
jgi:predicted tellurium resistance membrane protein TerC